MRYLFFISLFFSVSASGQLLNPTLFSKWTPKKLGSTLLAWYDANSLGLADATAVSSWTDLSGNGYHITQATGSAQPTFKTNIQNGKHVVRFDGGDHLQNSSFSGMSSIAGHSIFIVYKRTSTASTYNTMCIDDGATVKSAYILQDVNDGRVYFTMSATSAQYAHYAYASTAWTLHETIFDGSLSGNSNVYKIYRNSTLQTMTYVGTIASTTPSGQTHLTVGKLSTGASNFNGDIAEIIICTSALSATDRVSVENYIKAKYAIW